MPSAAFAPASPAPASAATPAPPILAAPELLLPETNAAPVAEPDKRPSWGFILGGAALAILAGLGLTLLLEGRQPHPQLPIGPIDDKGSVTVGPSPTAPVVEALDLGAPPPPVIDAAVQLPTPIAPHVPLPPLRGLDNPEPTAPSSTPPPAGDPVKATTPPAGTEPTANPGTTPAKTPGATATPPAGTAPGSAVPPRPQKLPTPVGTGTGDPTSGTTPAPSAVDPTAPGKTPAVPASKPTPDPVSPPAPTAAPDTKDKSPDELMKEAQAAYVRGERGRATELALQVAEGGGADAERAWRFIGSAACSVRNALMANKAYSKLESTEHKQMLLELCQRNGLNFQNGTFGNPPGGASGASSSGTSGTPSSSGASSSSSPEP